MDKNYFSEILKKTDKNCSIKNFELLKGGSNNRVYKIDLAEEKESLIIKWYFSDNSDKRNRLNSEFSFLSFIWNNNIKCIPRPIHKIEDKNIGVYSYIKARPFEQKDVSQKYIQEAIDFYIFINEKSHLASGILKASEACISYDDYINSIDIRLKNLSQIQDKTIEDRKALNFLKKDLFLIWEKIKIKANKNKNFFKIPKSDIKISPSDFGFHNTLINEKGSLFFIDFEYAGWDDPAKTLCDFYSQPKIIIENHLFESNMEKIASTLTSSANFKKRVEIVFPISQIKWCCVLLNSFLPKNLKRRDFANVKENKEKQLEKAFSLLKKIKI